MFRRVSRLDAVVSKPERASYVSRYDCGIFVDRYHCVDRKPPGELGGLLSGSARVCEIERQQAGWILSFERARPFGSGYNIGADLQRCVKKSFRAISRRRQKQQYAGHV